MRIGCNRKSNRIQQTHVLVHFVQMALQGAEEGKETEINKADLFPSRNSLSGGEENYRDEGTHQPMGKCMNQVQ